MYTADTASDQHPTTPSTGENCWIAGLCPQNVFSFLRQTEWSKTKAISEFDKDTTVPGLRLTMAGRQDSAVLAGSNTSQEGLGSILSRAIAGGLFYSVPRGSKQSTSK